MIGTRLGSYELIEEVGKRGMATVYRAYQPAQGMGLQVNAVADVYALGVDAGTTADFDTLLIRDTTPHGE